VAIGDFQSDADDDHAAKEREETKRLLYVALTRARDRLYLGTALKEGRILPARGSLAEVIPPTFLDQFATAADDIEWRASSGRVHRFRVCSTAASLDPPGEGRIPVPRDSPEHRADDFSPLAGSGPAPRTVASAVAAAGGLARDQAFADAPGQSDRIVGTLVHRILQRFGFDMAGGPIVMRETVLRILRPEEIAAASAERTAAELADAAVDIYRAMAGRPDIRALYMAGDRFHEVPFTMRLDGTVLRGTIDCLVRTAPDRMTVLEFKTGRPRDAHQVQLDFYRRAAQRLFPGVTIDAQLVYAAQIS
jgi:ATP-dependent helicase/nuclease subunit A